ncbi:MAG TPA: pyridoxamine 5'-phosphate oxidase family protein [Acidimicrobiales bacterium]
MSVKVDLPKLLEVAERFETVPLLLTTDADGRPRASAVGVTWAEEVATVRAGHRSVSNAAERPLVSLLWPAPPGQRFALFVDGTVEGTEADPADAGEKAGGYVTLRATRAILHVVDRPH